MTEPSQPAVPPSGPVSERRGRRTALGIALLALIASGAVALGVRAVSVAHSDSPGRHGTSGPLPVTAPDADHWQLLPGKAPLSHRWYATAISVDGLLVFYGGVVPTHCPAGSFGCTGVPRPGGAVYDPVARTWTRMAPAPRILATPPATAVDGSRVVYLSGLGYAKVVTYDVRTNRWRVLPPPLVRLAGNDLLAAGGGHAYVADQDDSGDGTQGRVQRVNLTTGRWSLLPRSADPSRLTVRQLFVTPDGLLMAGLHRLDPDAHDFQAQVEVLRDRHWRRYASPDLRAAGYDFVWAHSHLVAPFLESEASGRSLDPVTGTWRSLPRQPGPAEGGWRAPGNDQLTAAGDLVLNHGVVFDVATHRTVILRRPPSATPSGSGLIVPDGVYVLDARSRLWWQHL